MKYLITSNKGDMGSKVDMRFGRSNWFCIWDTECKQVQFRKNEYRDQNGGAGMKSAEPAAETNAGKVISGEFGPKAKALIEQLNNGMTMTDEPEKAVGDIIASLTTLFNYYAGIRQDRATGTRFTDRAEDGIM